ncbi:hypothetical protein J1614_007304 [Plenodomus biglobosus]|nr:hypothetical protein J1614_007304 [Plenodomus biglobosus]
MAMDIGYTSRRPGELGRRGYAMPQQDGGEAGGTHVTGLSDSAHSGAVPGHLAGVHGHVMD